MKASRASALQNRATCSVALLSEDNTEGSDRPCRRRLLTPPGKPPARERACC